MRTFWDVDEELYNHERPLYSWCASGAGSNPMERPEWVMKRERLTREWHQLCPYNSPEWIARRLRFREELEIKEPTPKPSILSRLLRRFSVI